jgi:flavin-dependent dehydrogenase
MRGLSPFGEMHVGGGGYCGVAPLGERRANVTFVLPQARMLDAGRDLPGFYRSTLLRWPDVRRRLDGATLESPPRAIGPLALQSRGVVAPGTLLVGDAAGFLDPFTGEGIALALRGALLAAEVAEDHLARGASLSGYAQAHRALVREKFRFNQAVQWAIARPRVANLAARILAREPRLADWAVGLAGDCLAEGCSKMTARRGEPDAPSLSEERPGHPVHR